MAIASQLNSVPPLSNGYWTVTTGGGVILDNTTNISILDNVRLSCGGTNITTAKDHDFRIPSAGGSLSKAIVLDPTADNGTGNPTGYTIQLAGRNSALIDCTIEAGAGPMNDDAYPNPYSPSVWYPDCKPQSAPCNDDKPTTHFRSAVLEQNAFTNMPIFPSGTGIPNLGPGPAASSIGITVTGPHATIRDVAVLGFGLCVGIGSQQNGAAGPIMADFEGDCGAGIKAVTADAPTFSDIKLGPDLTADEEGFRVKDSGIVWSGTAYQVTVSQDDPDFDIRPGDTVWITPQLGKGAESAAGYWLAGADAGCSGGTCTFSLVGSQKSATLGGTGSESPNIQIRTVVADGVPATAITGISPTDSMLKYVQIGQQVTDGSCFTNAIVTSIWPGSGVIYVSAPSHCDHTGDTFLFEDHLPYMGSQTDDNCVTDNPDLAPVALSGCALVDSNFRWGDGIHLENSGGAFFVNCHVFEYMISYHMYDGTRTADFTNCATGNHNDLPDRNLAALNSIAYPSKNVVSLLIDGSHHHVPPE